jgi:hypothetical protein
VTATITPTLAQRVSDHMTAHFPVADLHGAWNVACDTRDGSAVVAWRPGDEPAQPQVRGMLLYRWLCSLRDAGFTGEARVDMTVFGRPVDSPDGLARWLHITAWSRPSAPAAPLPPLPPATPRAYVALTAAQGREFRCPLTGIVPAEVSVRYLPGGGLDMTLTFGSGDLHWGQGVPRPPAWLLELVEQHRPAGGAL